jgi:hypothetical protein
MRRGAELREESETRPRTSAAQRDEVDGSGHQAFFGPAGAIERPTGEIEDL